MYFVHLYIHEIDFKVAYFLCHFRGLMKSTAQSASFRVFYSVLTNHPEPVLLKPFLRKRYFEMNPNDAYLCVKMNIKHRFYI